mmetsp:Transcript_69838/g.225838  ORF Transcript_69838/g.225838 Transcript_69838/m.225838 type:complete len:201 (-) Transcript_69838:134-736(-)
MRPKLLSRPCGGRGTARRNAGRLLLRSSSARRWPRTGAATPELRRPPPIHCQTPREEGRLAGGPPKVLLQARVVAGRGSQRLLQPPELCRLFPGAQRGVQLAPHAGAAHVVVRPAAAARRSKLCPPAAAGPGGCCCWALLLPRWPHVAQRREDRREPHLWPQATPNTGGKRPPPHGPQALLARGRGSSPLGWKAGPLSHG